MSTVELFDRLGTPARMGQLARYDLFNADLARRLDAITARSAEVVGTAVSMVSILLDSAQVMLSTHGAGEEAGDLPGIPAEWALCTYTVLGAAPYVVGDSTIDPRHADNPMLAMAGLRSYAGVPLTDDSGQVLGALCVLDVAPRVFTEDDIAVLRAEAQDTIRLLAEYRRTD